MKCSFALFSGRALRRMLELGIDQNVMIDIIRRGQEIYAYPNDRPYPVFLIPGYFASDPIHVVAARDQHTKTCFVVTAYRPDPKLWSPEFTSRRQK